MIASPDAAVFAGEVEAPVKKPWRPKSKHHAIYDAAVIECRTQESIASQWGLDQSTVSRIVRKYEAWRGRATPEELTASGSNGLSHDERRRVDHWQARERNQAIYRRAMRLAEAVERPAVTTRSGNRGEDSFHEEVSRDQQGVACRFLRVAMQASEALHELAQSEPPPPAKPASISDYQIRKWLIEQRQEAEEAGRVPTDTETCSVVESWLRALCGRGTLIHMPPAYQPGTSITDLARAVASGGLPAGILPEVVLRKLADACEAERKANKAAAMALRTASEQPVSKIATDTKPAGDGGQEWGNKTQEVHEMHNCIMPESVASAEVARGCESSADETKKPMPLCIPPATPGEPRQPTREENLARLMERKRIQLPCSVAGGGGFS